MILKNLFKSHTPFYCDEPLATVEQFLQALDFALEQPGWPTDDMSVPYTQPKDNDMNYGREGRRGMVAAADANCRVLACRIVLGPTLCNPPNDEPMEEYPEC